jgi:F-type H+-transporting ATPase subunit alpha
MDTTIIEKLKKEIEGFTPKEGAESIGRVISVGDGIAEIEGLENAQMSEMVLFEDGANKDIKDITSSSNEAPVYGLILNLEEESSKAIILGETKRISEGMLVKSTGKTLSIPVSEEIVGRVINPLGEVLDGKPAYKAVQNNPIEREAYGVIDRKEVNTPVHTGTKAIDAMIPIGRGQRQLIIGDRFTGKTTIAIDTILNQKNEPKETRPTCIYVAIGQKTSKTAQLKALLEENGAMEYTTIISASSADPAALLYLAPFAGAAVGEYFMDQGKDAIVIYDDLSKHAVAYRQISLLLRRPPGREAYPGDIFYLHSRLLERAAKLSDEKGGGSLTALPIIETKEGDFSAYIPTNVISITDGQIYLDTELFNKNMRPAINAGISVSRVGSSAQTKAMKKVAGKIRLQLAQFRELEAFMQFAQDLDPQTKAKIESGQRLTEVLKQNKHNPLPFERQVPVIYSAVNGFLKNTPIDKVMELETKLLEYVDREFSDIYSDLREKKEITEEIDSRLQEAMKSFQETHPQFFESVTLTEEESKNEKDEKSSTNK